MNRYRYDWVAYTSEVLLCWEVQIRPDGTTRRQMVRLMVIGEVTSDNVRAIPVRLFSVANPDNYPTWKHEVGLPDLASGVPAPPQHREVIDAWQARRPVRLPKVRIGPRGKGESVEDFYRRVANAYRILAGEDGKPTTALANVAGVNKNTAARWVHEARKRGYLEPTTRGKVTR
jgi:hypothetical protein